MFIKGWAVKDFILFFALVTVAVLVVKWAGSKIPQLGKVTDKM